MEEKDKIYIIEFKASRRRYYKNPHELPLRLEEWVIVEVERGEDMGMVYKIIDRKLDSATNPQDILRQATYEDLEQLDKNRAAEAEAFEYCLELIEKHQLQMKLVDTEYQFDCNKITFFFTAEQRVDFRALVKDLAAYYRTRIELRQIGVRDEARRLGGFSVCGLKQCCSSFIRDFSPISTQMARDQNLSLNPSKISGNCGRLLCCLQYEQEFYSEIHKELPPIGSIINTSRGQGTVQHINIFTKAITFRYENGNFEKLEWEDYLRQRKRHNLRTKIKGEGQ